MSYAHRPRDTRLLVPALALICLLGACNGNLYRQNHQQDFEVNTSDFNAIAQRTFELIDPKANSDR